MGWSFSIYNIKLSVESKPSREISLESPHGGDFNDISQDVA